MKLNNKGFAITAVLYGILILFVFTVSSYLISLSLKKDRVDNLTADIADEYHYLQTLPSYIVRYHANGGPGAPSNQTKIEGIDLKLMILEATRENYTFKGWGSSEDATTVDYEPGNTYTENSDLDLYGMQNQKMKHHHIH